MNKTKKRFKTGSVQKKMLAGSLAFALLLGGAIPSALAEEASSAAPAVVVQPKTDAVDLLVQRRLQSVVAEVAAITGKDITNMQQAVNSGQSIAQAANMSAYTLTNSMFPVLGQDILLSTYNLLTDEQIAKLQEEGRQKLTEALSTSGYTDNDAATKVESDLASRINAVLKDNGYLGSENQAPSVLQTVVSKRMATIIDDAVDASDLSLTDVLVQLELGSNLANATGMDTADLTIQLEQLVNEDIDSAAAAIGTGAATVAEAKSDAAKLLAKIVTENVWIQSAQQ